MKKSVKYWIMRAAALEAALQSDAADITEYSIKAYNRAIENINADIRRVYDNLGKVTGLNDDELRQLVSAAEHDELYKDLLKLYKETEDPDKKAEIANRINAQAYGARINRLEMIKSRAYVEMVKAANLVHAAQKRFYEDVFKEAYYTEIYNRVKGTNIGIDFSVLPKRAIELALNEPWHGYNYSERIWKHNERFTAAVSDTIVDGLITGQSHVRIAQRLEEFVADTARGGVIEATTTLVRSETSHFMNQGQLRSYQEMGTLKYRFCAAFSERTCDECADLDGNEYYISEAVEGKNYPPIHPNCRCITISADYGTPKERIARDPETGKTYKVAGNMTYREWEQSLTEEQRAAMQTHVRQLRNKSADKKQYERYISVIGAENMPKTLEKFTDLKYNNLDEWTELKGFYKYKQSYPIAERKHYKIYSELKQLGINNGVVLPPEKISAYILKDESARRDAYHIMRRMKERDITDDEVRSYKENAKVMFSQWKGTRKAYFSAEGVSVIAPNPEQWVFKTAWKKVDFDERTERIIEVINKYA